MCAGAGILVLTGAALAASAADTARLPHGDLGLVSDFADDTSDALTQPEQDKKGKAGDSKKKGKGFPDFKKNMGGKGFPDFKKKMMMSGKGKGAKGMSDFFKKKGGKGFPDFKKKKKDDGELVVYHPTVISLLGEERRVRATPRTMLS
jgi:hypothetical protein